MNNKVLSYYDWFLILGVIASNIIYSLMTGTLDALGSIAGITGVLCVVLVAKGSIWNYLFGLVNVSLYAWISFKADLYGDAALNALYYLPAIVGIWFPADESKPEPIAAEQGDVGFAVSTVAFLVLNVALGVAIEPVIELIELGLRLL